MNKVIKRLISGNGGERFSLMVGAGHFSARINCQAPQGNYFPFPKKGS